MSTKYEPSSKHLHVARAREPVCGGCERASEYSGKAHERGAQNRCATIAKDGNILINNYNELSSKHTDKKCSYCAHVLGDHKRADEQEGEEHDEALDPPNLGTAEHPQSLELGRAAQP